MQLKDYGVEREGILLESPVDLSFDGEYISGYIFMTKDRVGVMRTALPKDYVYYFRGVEKDADEPQDEFGIYDIKFFDIDKLKHIHIEHFIGTNIMTAEYDGVYEQIVAFTNRYQEEMNVLCRQLKSFVKDGDIPPEEPEEEEEEEEKSKTKKSKRSIFGRTLKYYLKYKRKVVTLCITYIVTGVISVAWPYLVGKVLFDHVLEKDDVYLSSFGLGGKYGLALLFLALVMIGCKLIEAFSNWLQIYVMADLASAAARDIKTDVFDSMSNLSLSFFTNKQTGGLMTRVLSDSEHVRDFFIDGLPRLFVHGMTIIATFAVMYRLNWKMALVACILLPLLIVMTVKLRPGLWTLSGKRHRAEKAVNSKANDNLTGARVVKAFGQENAEIERFLHPNQNLCDAEINIVRLRNQFAILYNMVQEVSSIWIWIRRSELQMKLSCACCRLMCCRHSWKKNTRIRTRTF